MSRHRPLRLFLDSNALQALLDHGGAVYEGELYQPRGRSGADNNDVLALRGIMLFARRGAFEFALSSNTLREVDATGDQSYLRWAHDVLDHWEACVDLAVRPFDGSGVGLAARLGGGAFGYLSREDALLIRDALVLECDTFLTIERRLPRNAIHLRRELGIDVLRPPEVWDLLQPHLKGL